MKKNNVISSNNWGTYMNTQISRNLIKGNNNMYKLRFGCEDYPNKNFLTAEACQEAIYKKIITNN